MVAGAAASKAVPPRLPESPPLPWPPELPAVGPRTPPVLSCPVLSLVFLEASRAPTSPPTSPPPHWIVYGVGCTVQEGGVMSDLCSPCPVFSSLLCPYLVLPVPVPVLIISSLVSVCVYYSSPVSVLLDSFPSVLKPCLLFSHVWYCLSSPRSVSDSLDYVNKRSLYCISSFPVSRVL